MRLLSQRVNLNLQVQTKAGGGEGWWVASQRLSRLITAKVSHRSLLQSSSTFTEKMLQVENMVQLWKY